MAKSDPEPSSRIFISYRQQDTAFPAGWLFDRLVEEFGTGQVFKDVDSIELGDDFVDVITRAVGSCDVLLALIGERWLTVTDDAGSRRLDSPDDFVRIEIEAALSRNVRIIPILVGTAKMPKADELPTSISRLARRQALELSPNRFEFDTDRLVSALKQTLDEVRARSMEVPKRERGAPLASPIGRVADTADAAPAGADKRSWRNPSRPALVVGVALGIAALVIIAIVIVGLVGDSEDTTTDTTATGDAVILADDFSDRRAGWETYGEGGGRYEGGSYRVHANPVPEGGGVLSVPIGTARLFPSSPADVEITVDAHKLSGRDNDSGFGIGCRVTEDSSYSFMVWERHVTIARFTPANPYDELATRNFEIDTGRPTQIRAACTGDGDRQQLSLSVNGRVVAEATDTADPLTTGSVGFGVAVGPGNNSVEAEFNEIVVRKATTNEG